jgi:hypothetical protein
MSIDEGQVDGLVEEDAQEDEELDRDAELDIREDVLQEREEQLDEREADLCEREEGLDELDQDLTWLEATLEMRGFQLSRLARGLLGLRGVTDDDTPHHSLLSTVTSWQVLEWADSVPRGDFRTWLEGVAEAMAYLEAMARGSKRSASEE